MTSAQKAKGNRWEREVRAYLKDNLDPQTYKPAEVGLDDLGDAHAAGAVFQMKDWRDVTGAIREGLDGAVKQAASARRWPALAVVKRARRPVDDAYAVFRLEDAVRLIALAREAEEARAAHKVAGPSSPPRVDR